MTTKNPNSQSEMQLYRVLQRANLLSYYDTFIAQGGDDVQQLCEAGEDEFLEIMALVGMASKPLHVRRLQKVLQEWVTNPSSFANISKPSSSPAPGSISASVQQQNYVSHSSSHATSINNNNSWPNFSLPSISPPNLDTLAQQDVKPSRSSVSPGPNNSNLSDEQIAALGDAAKRLANNLPTFQPKDLNPKKSINRELMEVMMMNDDDEERLDYLRKYAAIYGRFDSKRKNDRPMSLHELSVNEASAQLCRFVPALLTRREDLFPLARQVVRASGYQYSKGHSRSSESGQKKMKMDNSFNSWLMEQLERPVRIDVNGNKEHQIKEISIEIKELRDKMDVVQSLLREAKERHDLRSVADLEDKINKLSSRQMYLLNELEEFTCLPDSVTKDKAFMNGFDEDEMSDTSVLHSGASSPTAEIDQSVSHTGIELKTTSEGRSTNSEKNLFEEGLRIAQQYGLADFAEELKDLQQQKVDNGVDGDQSPGECNNVTNDGDHADTKLDTFVSVHYHDNVSNLSNESDFSPRETISVNDSQVLPDRYSQSTYQVSGIQPIAIEDPKHPKSNINIQSHLIHDDGVN